MTRLFLLIFGLTLSLNSYIKAGTYLYDFGGINITWNGNGNGNTTNFIMTKNSSVPDSYFAFGLSLDAFMVKIDFIFIFLAFIDISILFLITVKIQ